MLAALTKVREIELDEEESGKLAQAIGNVTRHYDIPGLQQQTLDWINLAMACGTIYGQRIMAYNIRKASERPREERPRPVPMAVGAAGDMMHQRQHHQAPNGAVKKEGPNFVTVETPEGPARVPVS